VALAYLLGGFMIGYRVYHRRLTSGAIRDAIEQLTMPEVAPVSDMDMSSSG